MGSLLNIGKSGLLAAQVGLATTGNNITNASVAGYSRQETVQANTPTQDFGYGYVGTGTEVTQVKRYYDDFLNNQLRNAQTTQAQLNTYTTQISQVDNLLSDSTAGLSPALQNFFNSVQNAASNPASEASRQAMLSAASSLAGRFTDMSGQLSQIGQGVNSQITSTVTQINTYAAQIAQLNGSIAALSSDPSKAPNDLLDQRDQALSQLSQLVAVSVVPGNNNAITVSVGNGQPLVAGTTNYPLATTNSPTDVSRVVIGYQSQNGKISILPDNALSGGQLGGLLSFRSGALDQAQNALGQIAAGVAAAFNAQHELGQDQNGAPGGAFFGPTNAYVGTNTNNSPTSTAVVTATVTNASSLTASDYKVDYDGTNFIVTRQSDNQKTVINPYPQTTPQVIDGVAYTITGTPATGDDFLVRPTYAAAANFSVAITDPSKVALAAPIATSVPSTNTSSATISPGSVDANYLTPGNALSAPVTLSYDSATNTLTGFPPSQDVTVTVNGVSTLYPAGTTNIPYTAGANINFGGVNVAISGQPNNTDQFTVSPNTNGVGDSRNGVLLAGLQTTNILSGNNATFQTSYAQLVNYIGNKASEAQISGTAADAAVTQASNAQQAVSGVNLDEEASNLLQYQQAYQAAGKVMQIASTLFDTVLAIGTAS